MGVPRGAQASQRVAGPPRPSPVRIAINVSALQVQRGRLLHTVAQALEATGVLPGQLKLEITESTLQSEHHCLVTLQALERIGVTLAIDDFGTGYSCLSSLKMLPIDRPKIDRAFVRDVSRDPNDAAIVEAIIDMAHKLDLGICRRRRGKHRTGGVSARSRLRRGARLPLCLPYATRCERGQEWAQEVGNRNRGTSYSPPERQDLFPTMAWMGGGI